MNKEEKFAQLEKENNFLKDALETKIAEANRWKELYLSLRHNKFAKKSEKENPEQLNLFDELENTIAKSVVESMPPAEDEKQQETRVKSYVRRTSRNKTMEVPANTPVHDVYHEGEEVPICEECGSKKEKVSDYIQETVTFIPSSYVVVRHHYPQYRCNNCAPSEGEYKKETLVSKNLLEQTICDPSLLAKIVDEKMRFGLPLYRLEQRFKLDNGCYISRQTASSWMMYAYRKLSGLQDAFERALRRSDMWNMDETGLKVVKANNTNSARNCHMIVRAATNKDFSNGPVVFTYTEHKRNADFIKLIGDYSGIIQSDGLKGYENASKKCNFTHLGCLIHARRKAKEVININKKSVIAKELLNLYGKIFHEEGILTDSLKEGKLKEEEFLKKRKEILIPLFDELKQWLESHRQFVLKGSKMAIAVNYPLERWDTLVRYLDYPFATNNNQLVERKIKNFALGRKNFLFSYTPLGAEASAMYYSIIETCKVMKIDTISYLTFLFSNSNCLKTEEEWDSMLPWNANLDSTNQYLEDLRNAKIDNTRTKPYILRGKTQK